MNAPRLLPFATEHPTSEQLAAVLRAVWLLSPGSHTRVRADGAAAERARCIEAVAALLREVEGPAARAPESHAGGEASALRRAVAALGALS